MRGLHAFQVALILDALARIPGLNHTLVDIGDSSGTHPIYLNALAPLDKIANVISVNLDPIAIAKVRARGGTAIQCRAEELDLSGQTVSLAYALEMLEHLSDPLRFLHRLATSGTGEIFVFTVPYQRRSRFGGREIRLPVAQLPARLTTEEVHTWELSPTDWTLLARMAGWRVVEHRIYRQYPRRSPLRLTRPLWARLDFEGFFGAACVRDDEFSARYIDW